MAKQPPQPKVELVHPLYLDVPMLISFLATLEGGVSYSSEVAESAQRSATSGAEVGGEAKLPSLTSLLGLNLSVSGRFKRDTNQAQSVENRFVRQHTVASLFTICDTDFRSTGRSSKSLQLPT